MCTPGDALAEELKKFVGQEIGPIAKPDVIQFAPGLPKTRSGKIMRRILSKIAEGDTKNLGDISTLADPSVVDDLVRNAKNMMFVFFWILASMGVAYAAKLSAAPSLLVVHARVILSPLGGSVLLWAVNRWNIRLIRPT